jgi:hypothetical protein
VELYFWLYHRFFYGFEELENTWPKDGRRGSTAVMLMINAYCTHRNPPPLDFPHTLNSRRGRDDSELLPHLDGFVDYVRNRGTPQMTPLKYHLIRHIQHVQHQISLSLEGEHMNLFGEWANAANAICFLPNGSIRDPYGNLLLDAAGNGPEEGAAVPHPEDALLRKTKSEAYLQRLGIGGVRALPPLISEVEVELREPADIARRVLGLYVTALRAESISNNQEIPVENIKMRLPVSFTTLTPAEKAFLNTPSPDEQDITNFLWGFEALLVLLWAIKLVPGMPPPRDICNVPALGSIILENDEKELIERAALRPASEILDALDLHFRIHWIVREARLNAQISTADFDASVVQERHRALNWLVRFENADWDTVDTST